MTYYDLTDLDVPRYPSGGPDHKIYPKSKTKKILINDNIVKIIFRENLQFLNKRTLEN